MDFEEENRIARENAARSLAQLMTGGARGPYTPPDRRATESLHLTEHLHT
jgi:hypothetical protein